MNGRNVTRNPTQDLTSRAVRTARSGAPVSASPALASPLLGTTPGTDGGGNIISVHAFEVGDDALDDPTAVYRSDGSSYDFGF